MRDHLAERSLDPLSDVLQDLRLSKAAYCRSELAPPWGLDLPCEGGVRFHLIVKGACWLVTAIREPLRIDRGDIVLLPHGHAHVIADRPDSKTQTTQEAGSRPIGDGNIFRLQVGKGNDALIVCGAVDIAQPAAHPLIAMMPEILHVRRAEITDRTLRTALELIEVELSDQRLGAATLMARLADVVIAQVIRMWAESHAEDLRGWIAAIRDPEIARILAMIHRAPGERWSITGMAKAAGLSRSTFSARFVSQLGVSPARYLARWRMHLASIWLRRDGLRIAEVASRLGYDDEASFSRAFKRFRGVAPGQDRAARRLGWHRTNSHASRRERNGAKRANRPA
jgi:AraC-like DNA-binding protein